MNRTTREARWVSPRAIDCELELQKDVWVPYTASLDDALSSDLFRELAGQLGDYVPPPPPKPLPEQIRAEASRRMEALVSGYTETEVKTWPVQIKEAEYLLLLGEAADPANAPILVKAAEARGISPEGMAQRVLEIAKVLSEANGTILAAQFRLLQTLPEDYTDDRHWV